MGKEDKALRRLFRHNEVVAGVLNHELTSGEAYFQPDWFTDGNPAELAVAKDLLNVKAKVKERVRDVCRILAWESDGRRNYLFLGIENQSAIDPFMPLRVPAMNIMNYDNQRELFMDQHPKFPWDAKLRRKVLSLMKEGKVLHPVLTIVIYTGKEPWDAPRCLKEMVPVNYPLEGTDIPDFQMRLLSLREIPKKMLPRCEKNLRTVVKYLQCEDDSDGLLEMLESDPDFKEVHADTVRAIEEITGAKIDFPPKQEIVDMCYAQKMLLKREREAERKKGIQAVIATAKVANLPDDRILALLTQMYELTQEEAEACLRSNPEELCNGLSRGN